MSNGFITELKIHPITIDGRPFFPAAIFPEIIRQSAVRWQIDFKIMDGKIFLDAEQMVRAMKRDTAKLNYEAEAMKSQIAAFARRHPLRYCFATLARWFDDLLHIDRFQ